MSRKCARCRRWPVPANEDLCEECFLLDCDENTPPEFKPFMLRCLTYAEALQSMRHTGCAIRRPHWCAPVLVYRGTRLLLDDEGEMRPWKALADDRRATDWEMVERPSPP